MTQSSTETPAISRVIKPHWFLRLFGVEPVTLSLIDERLELKTVNGQRYTGFEIKKLQFARHTVVSATPAFLAPYPR